MTAHFLRRQLALFEGGILVEHVKPKHGKGWWTGYCPCGEEYRSEVLFAIQQWESSHMSKCAFGNLRLGTP